MSSEDKENYGVEFGIKEDGSKVTTTVYLISVEDNYMGLSLTDSTDGEFGFARKSVDLKKEHVEALRDSLSAFLDRQEV